ncbi:MAG: ADP-ribosylglycohydrolase family protein [Deltaproteobacteria bacterium]|nr:ADP-ribosylglycohydrolase family protein [Deltaproteobacteria bacterium]
MQPFVKHITLGALVADSYCLGAHWIYDEQQLAALDLDWQFLNDPRAHWHPNRTSGQQTHYGDQLLLLYDYAKENQTFHLGSYMKKWFFYMRRYDGYMDGATTNTLDNLRAHNPLPCGFGSEDLSVAGRIAPLLQLSPDEETFLKNVDLFTRATHFTQVTRDCSQFCARMLWRCREGASINDALETVLPLSSQLIRDMFAMAQSKIDASPFTAIRQFGPDCNARKAMPGALYLLFRYGSDYRTAMMENAKAGGDSAARGMVTGMLMVAAHGPDIIPGEWLDALAVAL